MNDVHNLKRQVVHLTMSVTEENEKQDKHFVIPIHDEPILGTFKSLLFRTLKEQEHSHKHFRV